MKYLSYLLLPVLFSLFAACGNLEKEINLELPQYQSQYVMECYLEPGQPFSLLLTKSVPYFQPFPDDLLQYFQEILVDSADVVITHKGKDYPLKNQLFLNPFTQKVNNYYSDALVPTDYENDFLLKITTPDGKTITSRTRLLPIVPIDSIVIEFSEKADTLARALTYLTDDPNASNYYRRMLHLNSLDSIPQQDFATNDDFVDNKTIVFGTGYDFKEGDTIYNTLYHIERPYFLFWESIQNAIQSNGNPFGQPSAVLSNLEGNAGAIGVFTCLSYDRVMTIVKK